MPGFLGNCFVLLLCFCFFAGLPAAGIASDEGKKAPNLCWSNEGAKEVCLYSFKDKIKVLYYATGHCPSCEPDITALLKERGRWEEEGIVFLFLATEGTSAEEATDVFFLRAWQKKLGLPSPVLASWKDAGRAFHLTTMVPNVVIVDEDNRINYVAHAPGADVILSALKDLIDD